MANRLTEKRLIKRALGRILVTYAVYNTSGSLLPSEGGPHNSLASMSIHVYA
jgi:hypothetical protein